VQFGAARCDEEPGFSSVCYALPLIGTLRTTLVMLRWARFGRVTRALVLGGGGPLGVGWQAGLLTALIDAGMPLGDADFVVGTSAGSIVGAQLTTGRPLADLVRPISESAPWRTDGDGELPDLAEMLARRDPADVTPEADWAAHFDFLGGANWPKSFHCTAFSLQSGNFAVWDASFGVDLGRAVASSCSVPGLVSAVTIGGRPGSTAAPATHSTPISPSATTR
jgi:NTE family protein